MPRKKQTDRALCGAKNRLGGACQQVAGMGTKHLGSGRCKYHGGATPTKHGIYSKIANEEEAEEYRAFMVGFDILHPSDEEMFLLFRMLRYATGNLTDGDTPEKRMKALEVGLETLRSLSLVRTRYKQVLKGEEVTIHFDDALATDMCEAVGDMIYRFVPADRRSEAENVLRDIVNEKICAREAGGAS
jgi:hypothetical protein